jgi:putative tricarboxylic transport membrane protein
MKEKDSAKKSHYINYGAAAFLTIWALIFMLEARKIAEPSSRYFPYAIGGLTIAISAFLVIKAFFNIGHQEEFDFARTAKAMLYAVILTSYVAIIYFAGFYIATPIYLVVGMLMLGQKKVKTIISVAIGTPLIIYLFFDLLLGMKIPQGIFFL